MVRNIPLEQQYLWIDGKVSPSSLQLIKSGLPTDKPDFAEVLFIGYAFADVPVGKAFSIIFPRNNPAGGIRYESRIIAVTQQFGKATNYIPNGWKTVCMVEFPQGTPEMIKSLPIVDSWFYNVESVCLCDEEAWYAIRKHST